MSRRSRARAVAVVLALAALAGCSAARPAAEPHSVFVIDQDFADPAVVRVDGGYAAFATNSFAVNVQSATSTDGLSWSVSQHDALPKLPAWAASGRTWAPVVSPRPGGGYLMYVTAEDSASRRQCIGVAGATLISGPYQPLSEVPLVCPIEAGGAIDPSVFADSDGSRYLVWKTDGNCCGLDTWIELAPLNSDGTALAGAPTKLIRQTLSWEGSVVEAPVLVRHGDGYVLFYSANSYATSDYAIGVALSDSLLGPYVKETRPLLSTRSSKGRYLGPGGEDVVSAARGDMLFFHSWDDTHAYRGMSSLPLRWTDDVPHVDLHGPSGSR